jgi:predicted SAM-dependent methyltransferase
MPRCREVRVDIDPAVKPDIVASMTDLGDIGQYGSIWCCHALEHLHPIDGLQALREFCRVLVPGGSAMVLVPDLEDVRPTNDILYQSPAGPITGLDMYYGHGPDTRTNPHMMHRTGFVAATLQALMNQAGFSKVRVDRISDYNLFGVGVK